MVDTSASPQRVVLPERPTYPAASTCFYASLPHDSQEHPIDGSRCDAHDTGGCTRVDRVCPSVLSAPSIGHAGGRMTTTGNAPYCADWVTTVPCTKDADCITYCGPMAACYVCTGVAGGRCAGPWECALASLLVPTRWRVHSGEVTPG
jgi:hypothetical protein